MVGAATLGLLITHAPRMSAQETLGLPDNSARALAANIKLCKPRGLAPYWTNFCARGTLVSPFGWVARIKRIA